MKTIKVKEIERYKDGGTTHNKDEEGNSYWVDNRIATKTRGKIYDRYPNEEGAEILDVKLNIL